MGAPDPGPLADRVFALIRALRSAGIPIPVSAHMDALQVTGVVPLVDRSALREGLAATLTTAGGERRVFDPLFEVYFPPRLGGARPSGEARDIAELLAEVVAAVREGDDAALRQLAGEAVGSFGGVENPDGSTSWFAYRVLREFSTKGLLRRILSETGQSDDTSLAGRLVADAHRRRLDAFTAEITAEVRRRTAQERGADQVARRSAGTLPEDVDFLRIGRDEEAAMRRAVRPLARRLATRLALRRRLGREGTLDARRTFRRALATGGVPVDLALRHRHVHKPELVLVCDVSGSVAAFARFTLLFCHALQGSLSSRVRSFAFVDTIDEVTAFFLDADPGDAVRRLTSEAALVRLDGHSDYGHALEVFATRHADALTPRTTVLVLGDARNNYRPANTWALDAVRRKARAVYWLNPEPSSQWGSGDSIAPQYAAHVEAMHECRNLRQLAAFVESLG